MPTVYAPHEKKQLKTGHDCEIRVALIGDSITELSTYPHYLAKLLGSAFAISNFGVCGTTITLDSASSYMYTEALKVAKKTEPDIVVIMLGTNDAEENVFQANFIVDYLRLIEQFTTLGKKPMIYLVKPPPIFSNWGGLSSEVLTRKILPAIEQLAKTANLCIIDVFSVLQNPCYFFDGVHPNDSGGKLIAEVVYHALTMN
jgi:lysophospholipase L1-like esterase